MVEIADEHGLFSFGKRKLHHVYYYFTAELKKNTEKSKYQIFLP